VSSAVTIANKVPALANIIPDLPSIPALEVRWYSARHVVPVSIPRFSRIIMAGALLASVSCRQ
jgi:hypothetical protein